MSKLVADLGAKLKIVCDMRLSQSSIGIDLVSSCFNRFSTANMYLYCVLLVIFCAYLTCQGLFYLVLRCLAPPHTQGSQPR